MDSKQDIEQNKPEADQDFGEQESQSFVRFKDILQSDLKLISFARYFREQNICWRCVLMYLRFSSKSMDLRIYRDKKLHQKLDVFLGEMVEDDGDKDKNGLQKGNQEIMQCQCAVCQGVL